MKQKIIIIIFSLLIIGCVSLGVYLIMSQEEQGAESGDINQVVDIIDGDTFRLQSGDIVRLLCVDTPEEGEEGYDEAMSYLGNRILFSNFTLVGNETDRYGRLLRFVYIDDELVNREIVDLGLGSLYEVSETDCSVLELT